MNNKWQTHKLQSMNGMLDKALKNGYAVLHINALTYDWARTTIITANETNSPIIVAVTKTTWKNFGGPKGFANMVFGIMDYYSITVPVAIHLDHGGYEDAIEALEAGFSSVMFDGSHFPFEENLTKTAEIVRLAALTGASVECEVGPIGGVEDGAEGKGEQADPEQCKKISDQGIDALAAGIGNIHGLYPANWKGLNLELLETIQKKLGNKPLVLHGGTGIPDAMVKEAISLGVAKVNVATETQIAFTKELKKYFSANKDEADKGYDPRKYLPFGYEGIKNKIIEKLKLTGSFGKA